MIDLPEAELDRLRERVAGQLADDPRLRPSPFLDNLIERTVRRYGPLQEVEEDPEAEAPPTLEALPGGQEALADFVARELVKAADSPYFELVQRVASGREEAAVAELMETLDRQLKLRGIVYRHRLDPDEEYPALWSRVWEAIPKWDGRDFRAYVARIVRNHCLDEIARRKKAPVGMEDDPREVRPGRGQTGAKVASRDALSLVMALLDELEATGRIKPLDGVIFGLISQGRSVADVVEALRTTDVPPRFAAAFRLLGGVCEPADAVLLRLLVDGLLPEEVARLSARPLSAVAPLAAALGSFAGEELVLARELARPGLSLADLERAQRLTTNAINLCINRIRLKVWMGLVDKAYEALRRRGAVGDVELALVRERCSSAPSAGCRMYKDSTCKREVAPADIARRAGLDLSPGVIAERMKELRRAIVEEGLGMVFPDYNACLVERKPTRGQRAAR